MKCKGCKFWEQNKEYASKGFCHRHAPRAVVSQPSEAVLSVDVAGEGELLDACRKCYASLFADRAIHKLGRHYASELGRREKRDRPYPAHQPSTATSFGNFFPALNKVPC